MARGRLRVALVHACIFLAACSASPEELLSDARAAIAAGEYRTAEIHLKNLLQLQRDNATARQLLGETLLAMGDAAGAEQNFTIAVELGADASAIDMPLLNALMAQFKFDEMLQHIAEHELPRTPDQTAGVAVLKGAAYRGLRQPERAVETYQAALATHPDAVDVRTELAATLLALGRGDEGRALVAQVLQAQPNYAPALLLRGNIEAGSGQRAAAEATLQQVVDIERPNAARSQRYRLAMGQLIDVQVALGKAEAAAANADAFLALDARSPLARYAKALVLVQQGDETAAEQMLEALAAEAPEYWPAHRLLGAINIRQDQIGQATMYLRTAVTNNPEDSAARLQLAELYVRQGEIDAARTLMEGSSVAATDELFLAFAGAASRRAGLVDQASELFDRSEQQAPSDVRELVGLSGLYAAAGEFDRAIRVLQSSTLEGEENELLSDYLTALIQVRQGNFAAADEIAARLQTSQAQAAWPTNLRGVIALRRGDLQSAQAFLERAREVEPRNVEPLLNLARVAAVQNDRVRAEQYLRQVIDVEPAQPVALLGLAQIAMERGDLAAARTLLDRAPESLFRTRAHAELLALEGQFAASAQAFAQIFALQPSEAAAVRAYEMGRRAGRPNADAQLKQWNSEHPEAAATNFILAAGALERDDLDTAQRHYDAVIAINPAHAPTLNNLAWIYGRRGDSRAMDFAERALAADPENPMIADTVGWLRVQSGNAARGLPLLTDAASRLPDQDEVQYHWAAALADTGDTARAIDILARLTASGRDFEGRADAERRLRDLRSAR